MGRPVPVPPEEWFEKQFNFDPPVRAFPALIERLRGTPARVEELVSTVPEQIRTVRIGNNWSIQEHVGHLLDLEDLHLGRLADYQAGLKVLRAADLTNRRTQEADHNSADISSLLSRFRALRMGMVKVLETMDEEAASQAALHPRLQKQMRVVDFAIFTAEHDDHHLANITELARLLQD